MNQDSLYEQAAETYGSSLDRLARAYELDSEVRGDLLQEIHFQLWRSCAHFDSRCSLRTWVYRVAHNAATGHMLWQRRIKERLVNVEALEALPGRDHVESAASQAQAVDRLESMPGSLSGSFHAAARSDFIRCGITQAGTEDELLQMRHSNPTLPGHTPGRRPVGLDNRRAIKQCLYRSQAQDSAQNWTLLHQTPK